jgi:hypothetical protein
MLMDVRRAITGLQRELTIEPTNEKLHGPCECCGNVSRTVWGFAHRKSGDTLASYFVSWTVGNPQHDVYFDLILGRWGASATPSERKAVSLAYRPAKGGFMVIDAGTRPVASSPLISAALPAAQVVELPISIVAYAVVDGIWLEDDRIAEVRAW